MNLYDGELKPPVGPHMLSDIVEVNYILYKDRTKQVKKMTQMKIIVEKHSEGYVAYPLGLKGVVVGEGDTYEEALADVKSAIKFHIETFGKHAFEMGEVIETFVAEVAV